VKQKFIPGIYNYCDRWCERCSFTTRCRNYESTSKLSPEPPDINNKAFWDSISANFQKAIKLLHKAAKKHGIDPDKAMTKDEEQVYEQRKTFLDTETKKHPLIKLCKRYEQTVMPYFKNEISNELVEKTRELVSGLHMGIKSEEDVVHTMAGLGDCEEIIRWYLFFIDAKLQRALHGKLPARSGTEGEDDEDDGYPKDRDGSAKVAIIAIERSMMAWSRLYELLPVSEDTALNALSILSQLKQKAIEEFPKAMEFKRPGFDD
jgi:hypothetical protein